MGRCLYFLFPHDQTVYETELDFVVFTGVPRGAFSVKWDFNKTILRHRIFIKCILLLTRMDWFIILYSCRVSVAYLVSYAPTPPKMLRGIIEMSPVVISVPTRWQNCFT